MPDHSAGLLSQALFGEKVEILSKRANDWMRIKCCWDDLCGWVDSKQFYVLKEKDLSTGMNCDTYALEHLHGLTSHESVIPISIGSDLVNYDGLNVKLPYRSFQYSGQIVKPDLSDKKLELLGRLASRFMHSPHLKGGRSILGVDSAGLIQLIYKMIGLGLPRDIESQSQLGYDVGFIHNMQIGDLAFFGTSDKLFDQVGFIVESGMVIHVHGMVRKDMLDQQGVYDKKTKKYLYKLRSIRRVI